MTDMAYSRKERSISSWISMGWMLPKVVPVPSPFPLLPSSGGPGGAVTLIERPPSSADSLALGRCPLIRSQARSLDVQEPDVAGIGGDEVFAKLDVLTHEDRHDLVG